MLFWCIPSKTHLYRNICYVYAQAYYETNNSKLFEISTPYKIQLIAPFNFWPHMYTIKHCDHAMILKLPIYIHYAFACALSSKSILESHVHFRGIYVFHLLIHFLELCLTKQYYLYMLNTRYTMWQNCNIYNLSIWF